MRFRPLPVFHPGVTEARPCGNCGQQERFCSNDRVFTSWTACADEGECEAGATGSVACERCGTQPARCNAACEWEPLSECAGQGDCAPGETRPSTNEGCGPFELREPTCTADCSYGPGTCEGVGTDYLLLVPARISRAEDPAEQALLVAGLRDEVESLLEREPDARVALARYSAFINPRVAPFLAEVPFTDDVDELITTFESLTNVLQFFEPGAVIQALGTAAGLSPHPRSQPFDCDHETATLPGACWRPFARHVVLVLVESRSAGDPYGGDPDTALPETIDSVPPHEWSRVAETLRDVLEELRVGFVSDGVEPLWGPILADVAPLVSLYPPDTPTYGRVEGMLAFFASLNPSMSDR